MCGFLGFLIQYKIYQILKHFTRTFRKSHSWKILFQASNLSSKQANLQAQMQLGGARWNKVEGLWYRQVLNYPKHEFHVWSDPSLSWSMVSPANALYINACSFHAKILKTRIYHFFCLRFNLISVFIEDPDKKHYSVHQQVLDQCS